MYSEQQDCKVLLFILTEKTPFAKSGIKIILALNWSNFIFTTAVWSNYCNRQCVKKKIVEYYLMTTEN